MNDNPPRKRSVWKWIGLTVLLIVLGFSLLLNLALLLFVGGASLSGGGAIKLREVALEGEGARKAALIPIKGVISSSYGESLLPGRGIVETVLAQLKRAAEDDDVKAVILEIDSPGGGVSDSDYIYHEIQKVRKKGKPVVAFLQDMAASGAYYIAVGADKIIAQPTTITGNIGVIMHSFNVEGLFQKIGVKEITIKKGVMKDILSPVREMTPEEQQLLQNITDEVWLRFASLVASGRRLSMDRMPAIADGRIYLAQDALKAGLVDAIGYREDALMTAEQLAGEKKLRLIRYERPFSLMDLLGASLHPVPMDKLWQSVIEAGTPKLMYLWRL